jgi:hypothetical protein
MKWSSRTKVKGLKELVESLKKRKYAHSKGFEEGIIKSAYFVLRKALEIVPTESGYLASTGNVVWTGSGFRTNAKVVFTAEYSIWVHERLDLAHGAEYNRKYAEEIAMGLKMMKRPQEQAKFIETPMRQFRKEIMELVRASMKEKSKGVK